MSEHARPAKLIVTADDYGLSPAYDQGILEAAAAGAVDAVSAMVLRQPDPAPLREVEVEVGLHLEPLSSAPLDAQLSRFQRLFGRAPTHIDGHHHCHAAGRPAVAVARLGRRLGTRVRSVSPRHRRLLRCLGVPTNDWLVGRLSEDAPALPAEIAAILEGGEAPPGVTEWMVHPGHPDPRSGSSYDAARREDLRLLLRLAPESRLRGWRRGVRGP